MILATSAHICGADPHLLVTITSIRPSDRTLTVAGGSRYIGPFYCRFRSIKPCTPQFFQLQCFQPLFPSKATSVSKQQRPT